jgi:hypothetical protein
MQFHLTFSDVAIKQRRRYESTSAACGLRVLEVFHIAHATACVQSNGTIGSSQPCDEGQVEAAPGAHAREIEHDDSAHTRRNGPRHEILRALPRQLRSHRDWLTTTKIEAEHDAVVTYIFDNRLKNVEGRQRLEADDEPGDAAHQRALGIVRGSNAGIQPHRHASRCDRLHYRTLRQTVLNRVKVRDVERWQTESGDVLARQRSSVPRPDDLARDTFNRRVLLSSSTPRTNGQATPEIHHTQYFEAHLHLHLHLHPVPCT